MFDARISVPFGLIIAGPPLSGKSSFIMNLIDNSERLLNKQFDYIIWFYGEYNKTVELLENSYRDRVKTVHGLPENIDDYIYQERGFGCHIYDDLMTVASSSKALVELTSRKCQHNSISWIITLQNLFYHGQERKTLLWCAHYLVLFKNPLDKTVAQYLAARIMPKRQSLFMDIYEAATETPNGYLFIDGSQKTPEEARLRTFIFGEVQRVYIVKKQ